jgi:hypothetical protein
MCIGLVQLREGGGRIWTSPDNSPGLVGQPTARIVDTVEATQA